MRKPIIAAAVLAALSASAHAQQLPKRYQIAENPAEAPKTTPPTAGKTLQIDVSGTNQWTDTGLDLFPGTRVQITATGSLQYDQLASPDGLPRGFKDLLRVLPLNNAGRGALIGRIGDGEVAGAFLVGSKKELRSTTRGRLYLGVNQMADAGTEGAYHATIQVLEAGSADAPVLSSIAIDTSKRVNFPGVDAGLFAKIPRRIGDMDGNPGDMVNFIIVGTEDQVKQAFQNAGWVIVDKTKRDAVLHGLISTFSKQSYVELPMSELYLFGRSQDYGFAHAEPFAVVASRHHLRIWKAPFDVNGQTLWVGAATHDIGFDRDQRNNGVTHKIDPNIDDERKFVAQSLAESGVMSQFGYFKPADALTEARTATGGTFHSDGNILVMIAGEAPR
jgi:hypothetical protein